VAARLSEAGMRVTLLEADQPGCGTSRWSFAWVNSNDKGPKAYHDLNHAGIRAWAELAPALDGAAWYRPVGHVELAAPAAGLATTPAAGLATPTAAPAGLATARDGSDAEPAASADELAVRVRRLTEWGYPARLIDAAEAAALEPALRTPEPGAAAAWFPGEAYLLTEPLIQRLVASATARGATVATGDAGRVTGLDPGRVHTADGGILAADEIVCCAGRWTPELAALAGPACPVPLVAWDAPSSPAPELTVRVGPVRPDGPVRVIHTPQLALRPHLGGLLHLEAPDAAVDLHTPDSDLRRWAAELLGRARRTVRGLDDATVVSYQVCVRPLPLDEQSIVGRLPGAEWLYVAVTHSAVTLAAHLSQLIAGEVSAGGPGPELVPYRPDRFAGTTAPATGR
jgi:glycine/D-amino acid oxidase-like deaminating enzyme